MLVLVMLSQETPFAYRSIHNHFITDLPNPETSYSVHFRTDQLLGSSIHSPFSVLKVHHVY